MFLRDTEVFMGIYNGSQVSFVAVPPRSTALNTPLLQRVRKGLGDVSARAHACITRALPWAGVWPLLQRVRKGVVGDVSARAHACIALGR